MISNLKLPLRYDLDQLKRLYILPQALSPLWALIARLWIAAIFFRSGLTKTDDFPTTIALFADEYKVPILSPEFAALSATTFELLCPILLVLGLGTRLAAIPLLIMTLVIQFTYLQHDQHIFWMLILSGLIVNGGGRWSLDHLMGRRG